jgi:hypothetical protein
VDTSAVTVRTGNGSGFVGSVFAKDPGAFTRAAESEFGAAHRTIPPKRHAWQADVETFHSTVEREFPEPEAFPPGDAFRAKAGTCLARHNSGKEFKTPAQLLREKGVSPAAAMLPPLFLGDLLPLSKPFAKPPTGVYHVYGICPCARLQSIAVERNRCHNTLLPCSSPLTVSRVSGRSWFGLPLA